jgi:hypothetical protein
MDFSVEAPPTKLCRLRLPRTRMNAIYIVSELAYFAEKQTIR